MYGWFYWITSIYLFSQSTVQCCEHNSNKKWTKWDANKLFQTVAVDKRKLGNGNLCKLVPFSSSLRKTGILFGSTLVKMMMVQSRVMNNKIKTHSSGGSCIPPLLHPLFLVRKEKCHLSWPNHPHKLFSDVLSHQQIKVGSRQHGADIRSYHLCDSREGTCAGYRPQSTKREATELYSFSTAKLHRRQRLQVLEVRVSPFTRMRSQCVLLLPSSWRRRVSPRTKFITTFDLSCSLSHFPLPPLIYVYTSSQVRYKKIFFMYKDKVVNVYVDGNYICF